MGSCGGLLELSACESVTGSGLRKVLFICILGQQRKNPFRKLGSKFTSRITEVAGTSANQRGLFKKHNIIDPKQSKECPQCNLQIEVPTSTCSCIHAPEIPEEEALGSTGGGRSCT